ncbi:MAG: hypothetical protein ACH346_06120 [Chthoniobacterales bacterium]
MKNILKFITKKLKTAAVVSLSSSTMLFRRRKKMYDQFMARKISISFPKWKSAKTNKEKL